MQPRTLIASRGGNHEVAVNQHALGITPPGRFAAKPVHAGLPLNATIEIGADQVALTAHGVNAGAIHRRCAAGPPPQLFLSSGPMLAAIVPAGAGIRQMSCSVPRREPMV